MTPRKGLRGAPRIDRGAGGCAAPRFGPPSQTAERAIGNVGVMQARALAAGRGSEIRYRQMRDDNRIGAFARWAWTGTVRSPVRVAASASIPTPLYGRRSAPGRNGCARVALARAAVRWRQARGLLAMIMSNVHGAMLVAEGDIIIGFVLDDAKSLTMYGYTVHIETTEIRGLNASWELPPQRTAPAL